MKYYISFIIILSFTINGTMAQNNPYPEGEIKLSLNETFGQNPNWAELTSTDEFRHDANYREPASFTIARDGKIYMINNIKKELQLFDSDGKFVKTLAKISKIAQYRAVNMVGILDNKYIITENYNRLHIFNLDGSLFKLLYLDYPVFQVVPLVENTIAIYANVVYSGGRIKNTLILKNIITDKDKELEFHMADFNKIAYSMKVGKGMVSCSFPYSRSSYIINKINKNQLLVGFTKQSALKIYDYKGNLISSIETNIEPLIIADSVKTEFKVKMKKQFYKLGYKEQFDNKPINTDLFPTSLPCFHAIQVDEENNILVFLYTEGKPKHTASIYSVFSNKGKHLGNSTFICDDYSLKIDPASKTIHFGNKIIHAIVRESKELKSQFKFVKFTY